MNAATFRRILHVTAILVIWAVVCAPAYVRAADDDFPLRPYYPEVPFIGTEELLEKYDTTIIIDIRSSFEYDVAKINKAVLLPLTETEFAEKLEKLRPKTAPTPIVFYCNGHSCAKSYKAAQLALSLGFTNVFAYDGGIFDWISAAPNKATLMGETPARTERIISKEQFQNRLLDFETFTQQSREPDTIVIDIRDPFQREKRPRLPGIRNVPLDPLLDLVVSRIWTEKRLLFFDAVGKQIQWLQYFLESYGYFDYAFLDKGMRAIVDDPAKVEPVIRANRSIIANQEMLLTLTSDTRLDNSDRKVLSYLLANVKFNNYIVVDLTVATKTMGMSRALIISSVKKMAQLKYATYSLMQDSLIAQVDPRLAWKGTVDSNAWEDTMKEFNAKTKK